ncbi:MAG: hypothetical protein LiPW30_32 [Parcubacteria group bacterium LiPW_30]|nr:MAG: hypothetical protein LiPW30_32 [Parcubacteria group bacterium LiPW_30]
MISNTKLRTKNTSSILIYHHLGLGDHIMCHGIVREYCKKYNRVTIFSRPNNYPSVSFMFRDLENLTIIKGNDDFAVKFISKNSSAVGAEKYDEIKIIGFQNLNRSSGVPLEKQFYDTAGLSISKKWDSFYVERGFEKEKSVFSKYAPKEDYVFVHEDTSRKYIIKRKYINKNYKIFLPDNKIAENIFDYCTIIEKAKEIHVIDSSFMFLVDCLNYNNPNQKLYIHRYSRENNEWQLPILKKNWYIITPESTILDPIKRILESLYHSKIIFFNNSIYRRVIRKFFRDMGWIMGRPQKPDLVALIRRHVPEKSFSEVSHQKNGGGQNLLIAKEAGATKTMMVKIDALNNAEPSDIVFYHEIIKENSISIELLEKIRQVTKELLIINVPTVLGYSNKKNNRLTPKEVESMLVQKGFVIKEKHIFPLETCFVCKTS